MNGPFDTPPAAGATPGRPPGRPAGAPAPGSPGDGTADTVRLTDGTPDTVRLPGAGDDDPGGYSATALGSHWFEGPGPEGSTARPDAPTAGRAAPADGNTHRMPEDAVPDRVEGEVLRFGPGVTAVVRRRGDAATLTGVWHGTLAGEAGAPRGAQAGRARRGRPVWRRYAPAAVILAAVLAFLAWQRFGPGVAVHGVSVETPAEGPGCDGTADVVALVTTNGRAGTIAYRWERSDGTSSGPLHETVTRGQREARLHLRWTFTGRGEYPARAEVHIDAPGQRSAAAEFVYVCR
ncbi:hypothetical protein [Streptomyces sp. t39]|uniref:hypothetical protein n=1 Tax=Streptomyces sp. t39 TaxID=1828156 RepID=UPI0011CEB699|nr:hypothetical protein [Streptomyces sp. t39]